MVTGLIFGVFDGMHEGHQFLLEQARYRVDRLVVALPPDEVVERLKQKKPLNSWKERSHALRESGFVDEVVSGDETIGEYSVIRQINPDVILLGYDQIELKKDLQRFFTGKSSSPRIVTLEPFEPEHFKSSLLNQI